MDKQRMEGFRTESVDDLEELSSAVPRELRPVFLSHYGSIDKRWGILPHWEQGETCVFVTFHLADSLPHAKLVVWREQRNEWLDGHPKPWTIEEQKEYSTLFGVKLDEWLDKGYGSRILGEEKCREIMWRTLLHFDHDRYEMYAFVVMPTHVHALFKPLGEWRMESILQSWKGFSARAINEISARTGKLWLREYWDRLVRTREHFWHIVRYIRRNPEKARLDLPVYLSHVLDDYEKGEPT